MFAAALTSPLAPLRNRAIGTGVVLLGTASVIGATADAFATRAAVMVISGGVLFCAAEVADRSVAAARHVEHLPGVDRWSPAWVLGVAAGSAGLSYAAGMARGPLAGGGPVALAAGTAASTLIAFHVVLVLRARVRKGDEGARSRAST